MDSQKIKHAEEMYVKWQNKDCSDLELIRAQKDAIMEIANDKNNGGEQCH